ncbi:MAG TPA: SpoIVB peptidase [Firmicutes bacterium]|nr:SpoIVB peptidase [Bacillota bacterium]HBR28543.1 SpoIVB peptidase [Bacillota bacterium]HBR34313.1 SpoIVB peptidase [Bacillota bacterium]
MMPPRFRKPLVIGFVLCVVICLFSLLPQFIKVQLYPTKLKIVPGQHLQLSLKRPFSIYLEANRLDGINGVNGKTKLEKGQSGSCSQVMVRPEREGTGTLEIRFLGIPIRRVNLLVQEMPQVIPGGHAIGVLMAKEGVIISGHLPLRDDQGKEYYPAEEAGLEVGDLLIAINEIPIQRINQVDPLIQQEAVKGLPLTLTLIRQGQTIKEKIQPVKRKDGQNGTDRYFLGVYVEDPAAGVGTLTYYNPQTRQYGALGHKIVGFSNRELPLANGKIVSARITGINQGNRGEPGEKIGIFSGSNDIIGDISANTPIGIFGSLRNGVTNPWHQRPIPVSTISEVRPGPAEILTVLSGNEIRRFSIEIQKVYYQTNLRDKGMVVKVTDSELLNQAGGIIQGMSGSPIIQNGKLVGAITHVFVNDPTRGYGVFAEWMLQMEETFGRTTQDVHPDLAS